MPAIQTIQLPTFLPLPGEQLRAILPANHDSLSAVLGLALAYLKTLHPAKMAPDESMRASGHIISLLIHDPLVQCLLPKGPPSPTAPVKELSALQIRLTSLENTLANLAKVTTEVRKDLKSKPNPPAQPAKANPAQGKASSIQPTYAAAASTPQRPSVVVDTAAYTWPGTRPTPSDLCATINAALDRTNSTQVRASAARWTAKGNLVIWGGASMTATQLTNALPHFAEVLQTSLPAMAISVPQTPPSVRHNIKWSKLRINSVPTGTTELRGAYTPAEVHSALATENPAYASLNVTQKPSWVRAPDTYSKGSASSLSFAFEDPDGSGAQSLLRHRTLFVFGHVVTVKRWKDTPPKKKSPKTTPPAQQPNNPQAPGNNPPSGQEPPPSVYQPAESSTPRRPRPTQVDFEARLEAKRAARRRVGPS